MRALWPPGSKDANGEQFHCFLSYRHRRIADDDPDDFGILMANYFKEICASNGIRAWHDWEHLNSGDVIETVPARIPCCAVFVALLFDGCLNSFDKDTDWLRKEYRIAVKHRMPIVPVIFYSASGNDGIGSLLDVLSDESREWLHENIFNHKVYFVNRESSRNDCLNVIKKVSCAWKEQGSGYVPHIAKLFTNTSKALQRSWDSVCEPSVYPMVELQNHQLRVVTWNTELADDSVTTTVLSSLAAQLTDACLVVCLQEVSVASAEKVAGLEGWRSEKVDCVVPVRTVRRTRGTQTCNVIAVYQAPSDVTFQTTSYKSQYEADPYQDRRGAVGVRISLKDSHWFIANTHLDVQDPNQATAASQVGELLAWIQQVGGSDISVIAGDLNSTNPADYPPEEALFLAQLDARRGYRHQDTVIRTIKQAGYESTRTPASHSVFGPGTCWSRHSPDHIFVSPNGWQFRDRRSSRIYTYKSDHAAVICDF